MTDSPRPSSRNRGRVPLDQRSVVATAPGVPWWGALAGAVAAVLIGFIIDTARGDQLTAVFTAMYVLGCLAAVLIVRNRSLFTALVQPPLLLAVVVPLAYWTFSAGATHSLKSMMFDMALPLVQRFPTMVGTTVAVWVIGAFRTVIYVQERRRASGRASRKPRTSPSGTRPPATRQQPAATGAGPAHPTPAAGHNTSRRAAAPSGDPAPPLPNVRYRGD